MQFVVDPAWKARMHRQRLENQIKQALHSEFASAQPEPHWESSARGVTGEDGGGGLQVIGHLPDGVTHTKSVWEDGKVDGHVQPLTSILAMSSEVHRLGPPCVTPTRPSSVLLVPALSCPQIGVARREMTNGMQC